MEPINLARCCQPALVQYYDREMVDTTVAADMPVVSVLNMTTVAVSILTRKRMAGATNGNFKWFSGFLAPSLNWIGRFRIFFSLCFFLCSKEHFSIFLVQYLGMTAGIEPAT